MTLTVGSLFSGIGGLDLGLERAGMRVAWQAETDGFCDIDSHVFELKVSWRGRGKWAVMRHSMCLGSDGEWDYEPSPSNREDDWIEAHRFDLDEALRLAHEALPSIRVNGLTVSDLLELRGYSSPEFTEGETP